MRYLIAVVFTFAIQPAMAGWSLDKEIALPASGLNFMKGIIGDKLYVVTDPLDENNLYVGRHTFSLDLRTEEILDLGKNGNYYNKRFAIGQSEELGCYEAHFQIHGHWKDERRAFTVEVKSCESGDVLRTIETDPIVAHDFSSILLTQDKTFLLGANRLWVNGKRIRYGVQSMQRQGEFLILHIQTWDSKKGGYANYLEILNVNSLYSLKKHFIGYDDSNMDPDDLVVDSVNHLKLDYPHLLIAWGDRGVVEQNLELNTERVLYKPKECGLQWLGEHAGSLYVACHDRLFKLKP